MEPERSGQGKAILEEVRSFMADHIYPNEEQYEAQAAAAPGSRPPLLGELREQAKKRGLWNLFLPHLSQDAPGTKLSYVDYAPVSEEIGKVDFAAQVFNSQAPDSGNMEILNAYGSERVKQDFLAPLLEGEFRSAFSMTEPDVASSDASNIGLRIEREDDEYVLNGTKWFTSGALAEDCKMLIVMGKSNPNASRHRQQSMVVVPRDAPGVHIGRRPHMFGYDHGGGHPEIFYENVRVPADHLLGEEGGGFAIGQARLGPGRIHHCMRSIGVAERALELMVRRSLSRQTFGTLVAHKGEVQSWIAEARIEIDMARQYVLHAAHLMDTVGNKSAATVISGIKVAVPNMALKVIDRAIQVHGAAGVTQYTPLAHWWALQRSLRIGDGPDEVHKMTIARREILKHDPAFRMQPQ